ncbi:hypothetical protein AQUCO_00201406v1 [Aquilegia coerulea]|uniref:Uncharacterized protein n=1 Tax=Aquilegia coerulea TaxID=218851 RepID=A0A2G5F817_AQUCA|nr:hypothetical protein AQUCO_00201406v1 [Aquilegia coerulea]
MPQGSTTLYILIRYNTKYKVYRDWFCIDPKGIKFNSSCQQQFDEFGNQTKFLSKPLFSMPPDMPDHVTCVAVGSKIYSLGGYDSTTYISHPRIYNKAYVYDTAAHDNNNNKTLVEWERIPSMLLPRSGPSALVVDEKLIVMGSDFLSNWTRGIPWSEVYDPINNTWSTFINQPPSHLIFATISNTCVPSVECLFVGAQYEYVSNIFPSYSQNILLLSQACFVEGSSSAI